MRRYTATFADYYRRAFLAFERGHLDAVPDPWIVAFATATEGTALVAQDAFLGINAHINYDLALTLRDVGIDPDRPRKPVDHRAINDVLADLIDARQAALADLYAPGIDDIDASFGRFDGALSLFSMIEGRAQAWHIAAAPSTTHSRHSPPGWTRHHRRDSGSQRLMGHTPDGVALSSHILDRIRREYVSSLKNVYSRSEPRSEWNSHAS